MTTEWTDLQTIGSAFPMDAQSSSPRKPATHRKGIPHMPLNSEPRQAWNCVALAQVCSRRCSQNTGSRSRSPTESRSGSTGCSETLNRCESRLKLGSGVNCRTSRPRASSTKRLWRVQNGGTRGSVKLLSPCRIIPLVTILERRSLCLTWCTYRT
jgi:hypothetical protein